MNKTKYLYGDYIPEPIPKESIESRLKSLNKHMKDLLKEDYRTRDTKRVAKVYKAIKFWEKFQKGEWI